MQVGPENRTGAEGRPLRQRGKIGLETPLSGRFWGENKRLLFAPPPWYQLLVAGCFLAGALVLASLLFPLPLIGPIFSFAIGIWFGPALIMSGFWAVLSSEYMLCDLRSRTYYRREGGAAFRRGRRGSLAELDAVVLLTEELSVLPSSKVVIYRLVVYWKRQAEPLLIIERDQMLCRAGQQLNFGCGRLLALGQRFAHALGVPFYDNSQYASPKPLRPV